MLRPDTQGRPPGLSDREQAVAAKFAAGLTYREIGEELFIAPTTVRTHLSAIYQKLGVRTKLALAARLASDGDAASLVETAPWEDSRPPVVAVVPFDDLSGEERWTRLADGLSADLIADLARYRDVSVIARHTMLSYKGRPHDARSIGEELNADYVIEGTLQADEREVRISVQLVDARNGFALWSARYDRPVGDLFAIQDSVTENVVNVLASGNGKLPSLRRAIVRRKHPANFGAYDCYLLGVEAHDCFSGGSNLESMQLLSRAVELDPELARAWTALGLVYTVNAYSAFLADQFATFRRAEQCLAQALMLDPADSVAHIALNDLRAQPDNLERIAAEHDVGLAMAPNDTETLSTFACSRALVAGDPKQGYEAARRAIRINPHIPWYHIALGRCCFVLGRYEECLAALRDGKPEAPASLLFVAMAQAMLGQRSAAEVASRLRDDFPSFTAEGFMRWYPVTNPPAVAAIREGARRADLA